MKSLGFILSFFIFFNTFSQEEIIEQRCSSYHRKRLTQSEQDSLQLVLKKKYGNQNRSFRTEGVTGIVRIPIVVHVIHNNPNGEIGVGANISDEQIKSQIVVLNEDYRRVAGSRGFNSNSFGADMEVEFFLATTDDNCLATKGITRHFYSKKAIFDVYADEQLIKSFDYWPNNKFLNIWITSLSGGVLGVSPFPNNSSLSGLNALEVQPELDGIIINHKAFGSRIGTAATGSYSYGRTATHEVGHWLGLLHLWGDGIDGGGNCGTDYCVDTPETADANQTKNNCAFKNSVCSPNFGQRVLVENYLEYSEDLCMNIFTQDQKTRIRNTLNNSAERFALAASVGGSSQIISSDFIEQDFNAINSIADLNWTQTQTSVTGWTIETTSLNQKNILIKNSSTTTGIVTALQTIFYDLPTSAGANLAVLNFETIYPDISETDDLVISIYKGCKVAALPIITITGTELISNGLPKKHSIAIPKLPLNVDYLKLQFENHSKGKADLRLDNINVDKPFVRATNLQSKVYYNSIFGPIKIVVSATDSSDLQFDIIDVVGKKYYSNKMLFSYTGEYDFPDFYLPNGMYFLRVTNATSSVSTKFLISQ